MPGLGAGFPECFVPGDLGGLNEKPEAGELGAGLVASYVACGFGAFAHSV